MKASIFVLLAVLLAANPEDDQVNLGIAEYDHRFYSGYLDIDISDKSIHYMFFESLSKPAEDPLVLWLSGGPGCSSLLATFQENGPLIIKPGQMNLTVNPNSWNQKANLLYLEIPIGVGFSQGTLPDPITDDFITQNTIFALRLFLQRFPMFMKSDLYLTGHGFAGSYVPKLAAEMIKENKDPLVIYNHKWTLKGILLGNPCTKRSQCYKYGTQSFYHYEFLYKRAFFSERNFMKFSGSCTFQYEEFPCFQQRMQLDKLFNGTNSSMYNIYGICYKGKNNSNYINSGCEDEAGLKSFLNNEYFQKDFNIRQKVEWKPCNQNIYSHYSFQNQTYPLYPMLIENNLRIWIYSGDLDSSIPLSGTKHWVKLLREELQMPVKKVWREWWVPGIHKGEDQVGGYTWELRDLTLVTVKGAGFRAGLDQPKAMQEVLENFMSGASLPKKNEGL